MRHHVPWSLASMGGGEGGSAFRKVRMPGLLGLVLRRPVAVHQIGADSPPTHSLYGTAARNRPSYTHVHDSLHGIHDSLHGIHVCVIRSDSLHDSLHGIPIVTQRPGRSTSLID